MATYQIPPPEPMCCAGDLPLNWKTFREAFEDYAIATELTKKSLAIQVATLKSVMGKECKQILNRLQLTEDELEDTKTVLDRLEAHFAPTRNVLYERYVFHTAEQQPNETVDQYVIRLRHLAEACKFNTLHEEMIRDRLVLGCRDKAARARLFRQKECDLKNALESLRISEATNEQLRKMGSDDGESVHAVRSKRQKDTRPKQSMQKQKRCRYCGSQHDRGKCPAFGKVCRNCGKENHFQAVCESSKKLCKVEQCEEVTDSDDSVYNVERIGAVTYGSQKKFFAPISFKDETGEAIIECQLDTGATCNVMSFRDLCEIKQHGNPIMKPTKAKLKFYDNNVVMAKGECDLECSYQGKCHVLHFKIIEGTQPPLLSGETCNNMGLITVNLINQVTGDHSAEELIEEYGDVFDGLGCLKEEYHIEIDSTVPPVQHAPRRVPVALKEKLKAKIDELERREVIKRVDEPTPWISSLVAVLKPGKLRVCLDPRDLNKAIKRPKYQMPILEEVLPRLATAKVFSVLDAKDGFHQVKLDEPSSYLTTFWTPFGRYRYLRMPFGLCSAPEEYQRRMHEIIEGLPGVEVIADDILVVGHGETEEQYMQDHDTNLRRLLQRARETNLKLNKKKLRLRLAEVPYMGHLLTREGVRPDPTKVEAIRQMPQPEDKEGVRRVLGFVNYLSSFLPRLAEVAEPLRRLTEKQVPFHWESAQEQALQTIKELVISAPVLKFYDVNEEITVQSDASKNGLGATLLQGGQPVAFASRALSKAEENYAQIEKECLSVLFACERFDQYLHGRELITVQTDHKPLIPIFSKPLFSAPKRLQRMLLRLQKYHLEVQYLPGSKMYIADMLSRAYLKTSVPSMVPDCQVFHLEQEEQLYRDIEAINQAEYLRISDTTHQLIKKSTQTDPSLQTLVTTVLTGWPETKEEVPVSIRGYWNYRDEITAQDGILYKGQRVIIPRILQPQMLQRIHSSHQGAESCIRRAKDVLFWPGMTSEIKDRVGQCSTCNEYLSKQQREPLMTYEIPTRPWKMVAQDLFTMGHDEYLITVDYFSDYWELDQIADTTSQTVVGCTKAHFARYGIPETVITDNGPQFVAKTYEEFATDWEFNHITTSPYHSQSNGKVEAAVKIAKRLIKKAKKDKKDLQLSILDWRNTPPEGSDFSPVQKLQSRRTRTLLPTPEVLLQPKVATHVMEDIKLKRQRAKLQFDKSAKELPELAVGQTVRMQPVVRGAAWQKATTLKKVGERSYLVQTGEGGLYRRNRKFLKETKEPLNQQHNADTAPRQPNSDNCAPELVPEAQPTPDPKTPEWIAEVPPPNPREGPDKAVQLTRGGRVVKPPSRYKDYITS